MRLLIMSVGSLVGQNILDAIENRRDKIYVIGTNSIAKNPRNFRCDKTYLTTQISNEEQFESEFIDVLKKESPDLILAGRDEDALFLAKFKEKFPEYSDIITSGKSSVVSLMLNKYKSFRFAKDHDLQFADSFYYNNGYDINQLKVFVHQVGFPVVIKPIVGHSSQGVYFIINEEHLDSALIEHEKKDILFQEYLGHERDFEYYFSYLKKGIPLYFGFPDENQCAGQTIISPNGDISRIYLSIVKMVRGYPVHSERIIEPEMENLVYKCAKAFYDIGWYGLLNVQMKADKNGKWKVFEFNPRMTGSTSARRLLDYDEFGTLTDIFKPEFNIPNDSRDGMLEGVVFRDYVDFLMMNKDVEKLEKNKIWEKP